VRIIHGRKPQGGCGGLRVTGGEWPQSGEKIEDRRRRSGCGEWRPSGIGFAFHRRTVIGGEWRVKTWEKSLKF
jgi:hypothetical protein